LSECRRRRDSSSDCPAASRPIDSKAGWESAAGMRVYKCEKVGFALTEQA
jgi:hypothetical protein